jgi:hypothetical protein
MSQEDGEDFWNRRTTEHLLHMRGLKKLILFDSDWLLILWRASKVTVIGEKVPAKFLFGVLTGKWRRRTL